MQRNHGGEPDPTRLGACLDAWCKYRGISHAVLANRIGVSPTMVHELMHGRGWTWERQEDCAEALDIGFDDVADMPPADAEPGPPPPPNSGDPSPDSMRHSMKAAVDWLFDTWNRDRRRGKREERLAYEREVLRQVLGRAGLSGPIDLRPKKTPDGEVLYYLVAGHDAIVYLATRLINAASVKPPTGLDDIIICTWRNDEGPIEAVEDISLREGWVGSIRAALTRGWSFYHCLQFTGDRPTDRLRAMRSVGNVFTFPGASGRYSPRLLDDKAANKALAGEVLTDDEAFADEALTDDEASADQAPPRARRPVDVILVPGKGIIVIDGVDNARYFPSKGQEPSRGSVYKRIYDTVNRLGKESGALFVEFDQTDHHQALKHNNALLRLDSVSGRRYLLTDGIPQYLVPRMVHEQRLAELESYLKELFGPNAPNAPQPWQTTAHSILENRLAREIALCQQLSHHRHRDILPQRAITRFVASGLTSREDIDDTFAMLCSLALKERVKELVGAGDVLAAEQLTRKKLPRLSKPQRLETIKAILERLKYDNYELILLPDSEAGICRAYCLIQVGKDGGMLLQYWKLSRDSDDRDDIRYVMIHMSDRRVVRAFATNPLLRPYTHDHNLPAGNKQTVKAFLQDQITKLEKLIADDEQRKPR